MLTPKATERANIVDICSHWWINEGYEASCLDEAEHLANLTPVRLDLLLSLAKAENKMPLNQEANNNEVLSSFNTTKIIIYGHTFQGAKDGKDTPSVDIEEIPADTPIPDGIEECDVSLSEEPPDNKSPRTRKKKEHKRKHENTSSNGEIAKKHERQEEVHLPPPHHGPEPMEIVENEIYERPKERRPKSCDLLDESKTPKSRRKKSSKENIPENETQKRPPHKPKSPKPEHCEQNGEVKKVVRKKKHHVENGEPFERPEPRASPRPPRTPVPPEFEEENVKSKESPPRQVKSPPKKISPPRQVKSPPKKASPPRQTKSPPKKVSPPRQSKSPSKKASPSKPCETSPIETIPPPLPEKKHKSKSPKSSERSHKSEQEIIIDNNINNNSEFNNLSVPQPEAILSDNRSKENDNLNGVLNNNINESCDSTLEVNSSVINPNESINLNEKETVIEESKCEDSTNHSRLSASNIAQPQLLESEESASGKQSVTAESQDQPSQFSVQDLGSVPALTGHGTQAQDQNVSPKANNINAELSNKKREENVQPLVKPFPSQPTNTKPLEFPPKTPEHSSIKPPWAKSDNKIQPNEIFTNKSQEIVPKTKSNNEIQKPSINNLPKLVTQESTEPLQNHDSQNNKVSNNEQVSADISQKNVVQEAETNVETKPPPLVVPFPGKQMAQQQTSTEPKSANQVKVPEKETSQGVLPSSDENSRSQPSLPQPTPLSPKQPVVNVEPSFEFPPNPPQTQTPAALPQAETSKQESPRFVLNNIPKPFKPETERSEGSIDEVLQQKEKSLENVVEATKVSQVPDIPPPTPSIEKPTIETPAPAPVVMESKIDTQQEPAEKERSHKHPSQIPIPLPPEPRKQEPRKIQIIMKNSKAKSTDSIGSSKSFSSTEEKGDKSSSPNSPMVMPKPNGPNINLALLSPSNSNSNIPGTPDKRDSKVIKAAAYWNNFIGEVTAKSRPPSNPKMMDKPKKIVSAGIGERGLKELTTAFEAGKPIDKDDKYTIIRRNSKKNTVEPCKPGLRVNEAKSQFEKKFAVPEPSPTPSMRRRASGSLEQTESPTPKNSDVSKSPSPVKAEKSMTLPQPLNRQKSPEAEVPLRVPDTPKLSTKSKHEVQRNAVISDANGGNLQDKTREIESKKQDVGPKQELSLNKDQPKPPTSPKPKVRKEELKLKEERVKSKDEKPITLAKKSEEVPAMVAAIVPKGAAESSEQAKVVKTKDVVEKPPEVQKQQIQEEKQDNKVELQIQIPEHHPAKSILKTKTAEGEISVSPLSPSQQSNKETTIIKFNNENSKDSEGKHQVKIVKIKSPEPAAIQPQEPKIELADVRSSLKKVPHIAVARKKSFSDKDEVGSPEPVTPVPGVDKKPLVKTEVVFPVNSEELVHADQPPAAATANMQQHHAAATTTVQQPPAQAALQKDASNEVPKERIIPIQFINENSKPKPFKLESSSRPETPVDLLPRPDRIESPKIEPRREHHIPIVVEGSSSSSSRRPEEELEHSEKLDNFNTSSISRRRWGSRKKRMSSAFSDSSMSEDEMSTPFGGLQKYTSYGKHNLSQQEPYQLRKTRPPFSVTRTDSFSSGEDDLEDDGFQEMTAENLFSTLLSRVKSLTRRIHDEHEEHLLWQQKQRLGPPKLNPGGTHARLERTAQRNSIKRDRESAVAAANAASRPPTSYSRQSSATSYGDDSLNRSSYGNSRYEPTKIYNRSNSYNSNTNTLDSSDRYSTGTGGSTSRYSTLSGAQPSKRYDESDAASDYSSNISITSSQRLRPGYLPPPVNLNADSNSASPANRTTASAANSNELDAHMVAQTIISRAQDKAERSIPISIQRENSISVSSPTDTGTSSGGYMKSNNSSRYEDAQSDSDGYGARRVSRFLRPDFYDIPKEDSVYTKMRDVDDERSYVRNNAGSRSGKSGRSTPLEFSSGTKNDPLSPQFCDTSGLDTSGNAEGQLPTTRNLSSLTTVARRNSLREPPTRLQLFNNCVDSVAPLSPPPGPPVPSYSRINYTAGELPVENPGLYRRQIRPYSGAKSEGELLLNNKHANVTLNVIAAAERKKRQSQCYYQPAGSGQDPMSNDMTENMS